MARSSLCKQGVQAAAEDLGGRRPTILVVDDEVGPRESLRLILQKDFNVLAVASGEQALAALRTVPVDVVTLDLKMTGISGQKTLSMIKDRDPNPEVIVVTGYSTFDSAVELLRLRAFDYVSKPFDARRILDAAQRAAAAHQEKVRTKH